MHNITTQTFPGRFLLLSGMGIPWKPMTALALAASYVLTTRGHEWMDFQFSFGKTFTSLWLLEFLCVSFYKVLIYPNFVSPLRGLPQPANNSLFNGQYKKLQRLVSGGAQLEWINTVPNDGIIRYKTLFNQDRLLVTSPKALSEVLNTHCYDLPKPQMLRDTIGRVIGIGLLLAEGEEHKTQRKALLPAFQFRHIKQLYSIFWDKGIESVEAMTQAVYDQHDHQKAGILPVADWASRTTLDILGTAGLGKDFNTIADPTNELMVAYRRVFRPSRGAKLLGALSLVLPRWFLNVLPIKHNETIEASVKVIKKVARDMIAEKRERMARKELTLDVDILSAAIRSDMSTDEQLLAHLMTFMSAGHDTTSSAISSTIYMLSRHPAVQDRLRAEIRARLPEPGSGEPIAAADIDSMPYLHAVIFESIRFYSVVPLTMRDAAVDTTLQGVRVPKGTRIIICPWAINRSRALWGDDALEFRPERWLDPAGERFVNSGGATSNYGFMTFLHGPRSCIGQQFAKAELACLLACWVGRLRFEPIHDEEVDELKRFVFGSVTLKYHDELPVKVSVVDGW